MFGNVVVIVFQSVFHLKMHRNDIFYIFLKIFLILAHQNDLKTIKKLKKINFF